LDRLSHGVVEPGEGERRVEFGDLGGSGDMPASGRDLLACRFGSGSTRSILRSSSSRCTSASVIQRA
jgi:hypothetical protein